MLETLLGLAWVVEARDPYTGGHLWRVSRYAALLCKRAGTTRAVCARVSIGAFLHDLGKIGIPDAVLRKPSALSDDEHGLVTCGWLMDGKRATLRRVRRAALEKLD